MGLNGVGARDGAGSADPDRLHGAGSVTLSASGVNRSAVAGCRHLSDLFFHDDILRGLDARWLHDATPFGFEGADLEVGKGTTRLAWMEHTAYVCGQLWVLIVTLVGIVPCGHIGRQAAVNRKKPMRADLPQSKRWHAVVE